MDDDVLRRSVFWERLTEEVGRDNLRREQIRRLEGGPRPVTLYEKPGMYLDILAPDFIQNLQAGEDRDANSTSAIMLLKANDRVVIFAGDSTVPEWRGLMQRRKRPFKCDILTVPHHAGAVWVRRGDAEDDPTFDARLRGDLDWLYGQAVKAGYGIVSVGTNNQHRHPRPEVTAALIRAGVVPICTQMTRQCCADLEPQRARSLALVLPSRSVTRRDVNDRDRSRNVACAATVLVELRGTGVIIQRFGDHQAMIARLVDRHGGTPLCRPAAWHATV